MPGFILPNNRLTNCCLCIKLSTGCRIIGSLTALICCMEFLITINKFIELLERKRKCQENLQWESELEHLFYVDCSHITAVRFILITEFLAFLMGFISSLLLLYGIRNKQPKLFIAWQIFIGTVIISNFFTILFWRDVSLILEKIILVLILTYFFKVVKAYHAKLTEEIINGYPVVAVSFPEESSMSMFLSSHRSNISNDIKDDPPPPYPGPPIIQPSVSIEVQPPPYSAVNPNFVESHPYDAPSSSAVGEFGANTSINHSQENMSSQSCMDGTQTIRNDVESPTSENNVNIRDAASLPSLENINENPSNVQTASLLVSAKAPIQNPENLIPQSDLSSVVVSSSETSRSCASSPVLPEQEELTSSQRNSCVSKKD